MKKLCISLFLVFFVCLAGQAKAMQLFFSIADPIGDNTGPIDVRSMLFSFDNASGDYTIDLTADAANPFLGDFRININLFNPDTGTTAPDPSFFEDTLNDFSLSTPIAAITLTGTNSRLLAWNPSDNVFTNSLAGTGNPDGTTLFRSTVTSVPFGFLTNEDVIAFADLAQSAVINPVPIPCEIWTQVNVDGFGDTSNIDGSFIVFNGYLYAATENYITGVEIWTSSDGTTWEQVNQDGFGDPNNSWEFGGEFIIFQNQLYFLVGNDNTGVEVWTTPNGTTWEQANDDGFGDPNNKEFPSPIVFNNYLYVSVANEVTGIEIWRTRDGAIWEQVNQDGFGDPNNNGNDSGFTIFDGHLYILVNNDVTGVDTWRSSDGTTWEQVSQDGFGDPNNTVEEEITFQNYLYVATVNEETGTEVWRTPNGSTWEQVNQDGFGDSDNYAIWGAQVFGSYLYFATANEVTGTEIWRTPDGTTWEQVNQDGFGNSGNNEVTDFIIFGDYLYASTSNREVTGTEVWRTPDGTTWIQVNYNGFGDINNDDGSFTIFNNLLYTITNNYVTGSEVWVPITDSDGDGVPDQWDQCPGTPPNSYVDNRGCPAQISCDINGDGKIGLEEAIFVLQIVSGVRPQ